MTCRTTLPAFAISSPPIIAPRVPPRRAPYILFFSFEALAAAARGHRAGRRRRGGPGRRAPTLPTSAASGQRLAPRVAAAGLPRTSPQGPTTL
jgi:hypothetical protein